MNHILFSVGDYYIFESRNRKILLFIVYLSNQTSFDWVHLKGVRLKEGIFPFPNPITQLSTVEEISDYISDTDDLFAPDSSQMMP